MEKGRSSPPFMSMVRSSGHGKSWTHHTDAEKFKEFGWKATTQESNYENDTLIGNWNEERFDIDKLRHESPLPSQYGHYFETTHKASHKGSPRKVPAELKKLIGREPYSYPGHQPELDTPCIKKYNNSWMTTSRSAYADPRLRMKPLDILSASNTEQAISDST